MNIPEPTVTLRQLKRRARLLRYIERHTRNKGFPPTVREMVGGAKTNHVTVIQDLRWLEARFYIRAQHDAEGHILPRTLIVLAHLPAEKTYARYHEAYIRAKEGKARIGPQ